MVCKVLVWYGMVSVMPLQRFRTGTFASSEDIVGHEKKGAKVVQGLFSDDFFFFLQTGVNEAVERVRRAHLNDMENILPFFCLGLLYIFTGPALATATLVFRSSSSSSFSSSSPIPPRIQGVCRLQDPPHHRLHPRHPPGPPPLLVVVIFLLLFILLLLTFLPQPARALAFFGGVGANLYMAYQILTTFM